MPAKSIGAMIQGAGKAASDRLGSRLGRINDVHRTAVEHHYKAEAQQRAHEHTHSMLDKVHKYSGGGKVHLEVGADGRHVISYKKGKGGSGDGKSEGGKPEAEAPKAPETKKPSTPRKPREPKITQHKDAEGNITGHSEPKSRAQHEKELAEQKLRTAGTTGDGGVKPTGGAKPAAKPASKKPAATPAPEAGAPAAKKPPVAKPAAKTDKKTK